MLDSQETKWTPVIVAPSRLWHAGFDTSSDNWVARSVGKTVRLQPSYSIFNWICGCRVYEMHPEDKKNILGDIPGKAVLVTCQIAD